MEPLTKIEKLIDHTKEYMRVRVDEAKLEAAEKTTSIIALIISGALISLLFFYGLLLASIAASIALGHSFGKTWLGFLLVGAAWFVLGFIALAAKKRLIRIPVMNAIIYQLFKKENPDEEN